MSARTATDIVILCENRLGFSMDGSPHGLRKARQIEAGKINRKLEKAGGKVTIADLELAVEYCWRKREPVTSPAALFWRVDDARSMANDVQVTSAASASVEDAVAWEMAQPFINETWLGKLTRANGPGREQLLKEWTEAGRGT